MGRPSLREERRRNIASALISTLGTHGQEGTTIAAIASHARLAPGLVHHYFENKEELYGAAIDVLYERFRARIAARPKGEGLAGYADAALALDGTEDLVSARAWVGLFAEALSTPVLFDKVRRLLSREVAFLQRHGDLSPHDAGSVLSFVLGALVFGSFAPSTTRGFAAPALHRILRTIPTR